MHPALFTGVMAASILFASAAQAQRGNQADLTQASPPGQTQTPAVATTSGARQATRQETVVIALIPAQAATVQPASPEVLYRGMRAQLLLGQDVYGTDGGEIGEVEDIIVNTNGRIVAIVVEAGGFLDIGDATFRIPFENVDLTPGREGIVARTLTEEKAEDFGLFDRPEMIVTGPREFRLSELVGDYARLRNGAGYGYVSDVVFNRDGKIKAVLVNRDVRYGAGLYAYPYYGWGYGWDPVLSYYALPFDSLQLAAEAAPRVDRNRFEKDML